MSRFWYFIRNERTGQSIDIVAPCAEAACEELEWKIDDCVIIQVGEILSADRGETHESPPQEEATTQRRKKCG